MRRLRATRGEEKENYDKEQENEEEEDEIRNKKDKKLKTGIRSFSR